MINFSPLKTQGQFYKKLNSRKIFRFSHCLHDAGNHYHLLWFNFLTTFHNLKIEFCWTAFSRWFMPPILEKTPSFCTKLIREGSILQVALGLLYFVLVAAKYVLHTISTSWGEFRRHQNKCLLLAKLIRIYLFWVHDLSPFVFTRWRCAKRDRGWAFENHKNQGL